MIISMMDKSSGGFFSQLFFTMNHYLTAKATGSQFILNTSTWLFKYEKGWTDYFETFELKNINNDSRVFEAGHSIEFIKFPLEAYRNAVKEVYRYNERTIALILRKKKELKLTEKEYDSIFIRRGDKLSWESKYIPTEYYLKLLLERNPNCRSIFIQTDDYNCVLDLKKLIYERGLDIEVLTFCTEGQRGVVVFQHNGLENAASDKTNMNNEYISRIIETLRATKPVNQMNPEEIFEHTLTMIVGIEFVLQSNVCICDFQSNVSRFIKLAHPYPDNVIDVMDPTRKLDMTVEICPSYGFSEEERK
uniref:Uncharacterized protein n=1 Tax=viral metagenome TaxID=1070528 RepID=A0A6C0HJJ6_9ZZZZ